MRQRYALSLTPNSADFVYLFSQKITAPLNDYKPSSRVATLGNGGQRQQGWPINTWYWASLEEAERTFFRTYCPGAYANDIYIRTLNNENKWVEARTIMLWMPSGELWQNDNVVGFTLGFKIKTANIITL